MLKLRDYQEKAVNDISSSLRTYSKVVGWLPTSSGKSVIIAEICRRVLAKDSKARVLVLCMQGEILLQNDERCKAHGVKDSGVFCSGLKRKEKTARVVHASRDSLARNPTVCGLFDVIILDECHLLSEKPGTQYHKVFDALLPRFVVGLTGTPFRLGNGIIFGKGKFWETCAAKVEMSHLFEIGMLTPYELPKVATVIDTSGVKIVAGEFNQQQLEKVSTNDEVVEKCLDIWESKASNRKCTLIFCCSIDHANLVHEKLTARGYRGTVITGETDALSREQIISKARQGAFQYVCNVQVLTTGVDLPIVDCLLFLRATKSLTLFIQMVGRALRLYPSKTSSLMLDCAGNFERLGTPENPVIEERKPGTGERKFTDEELLAMGINPEEMSGETAVKLCKGCKTEIAAAARKCPVCGYFYISHTDQVAVHESIFKNTMRDGIFEVKNHYVDTHMTKNMKEIFKATWIVKDGEREHTVAEYLDTNTENDWVNKMNREKVSRLARSVSKVMLTMKNDFWRSKVLE